MTTRRMQLDSIPPPPTKFGEGFKCMLQATPEMSLAWTVKDEYIYFQQQLLGPGGWYVRSTPPLVTPPPPLLPPSPRAVPSTPGSQSLHQCDLC